MSWDYGLRNQISEDYNDALDNGYCYGCAVYLPDKPNELCFKCEEEKI